MSHMTSTLRFASLSILSARSDAVEIAVEIELEQIGRIVGWPTGFLRYCPLETESLQANVVDKRIQEADRVVFWDVFVERFRK